MTIFGDETFKAGVKFKMRSVDPPMINIFIRSENVDTDPKRVITIERQGDDVYLPRRALNTSAMLIPVFGLLASNTVKRRGKKVK